MEKSDPYIDSNTGVLKNLLNIKDNNKLKQAESDIVITRTCLVFLRTYLNSYDIKFDVNFFKHENTYKYMRDALVASAFESDIYEKEREYKYLRRIIGDIIELDQERKRKL